MNTAVALTIGLMGVMPAADGATIRGGTRTWVGDGSTNNWSNGGNWDGNDDIANGSTLVFSGSGQLANVNNLPNADNPLGGISILSVNGLTFASGAGAFNITGNDIISTGNITNSSSRTQTLDLGVTVANAQTWNIGSAGMKVGGITFAAGQAKNALTMSGTGTLTSLGDIRNNGDSFQTITSPITVGSAQTWDGGPTGTYTVGLVVDQLSSLGNNSLTVTRGVQAFIQQGNILEIGSTASVSLLVGNHSFLYGQVVVGKVAGSNGTLTLDGNSTWSARTLRSNGTVETSFSPVFAVGSAGTGTLNLLNNSKISSPGELRLGESVTGIGTVSQKGGTMDWGSAIVGVRGRGTLVVESGIMKLDSDFYCFVQCSHNLTLGELSTGDGTVEVGSTTSSGQLTDINKLIVGKAGSGRLVINKGSTVTSNTASIGGFQDDYNAPVSTYTGTGSVNAGGVGTIWTINGPLYVGGYQATGSLNIFSGATVSSTYSVVDGSVLVSGKDALWNGGQIEQGWYANSDISIDNGGTITSSGHSKIGVFMPSTVFITGAGSAWIADGKISVGTPFTPSATLTIANKGRVVVPTLEIEAPGTVNLTGGELRVGSVFSGGTFNWTSGTLAMTGAGGASLGSGLLKVDHTLASGQVLEVTNTLSVAFGQTLRLGGGELRAGSLALAGGVLRATSDTSFTGTLNWTSGAIALTDTTAARLNTPLFAGAVDLGPGKTLSAANGMSIDDGTTLTLGGGTLSVGTLNLAGGTLATGNATLLTDRFNWVRGTLRLNSATGASLGSGWLPTSTVLGTGQTLKVDQTLALPGSSTLVLAGGALNAGSLSMSGGSLATASGALNLGEVGGGVSGYGSIVAPVTLPVGRTLSASGGQMTVGDLGSSSGFAAEGTLSVGTNATITLLDADRAQLGALTSMGTGSRLITFNGANLGSGRVLNYQGSASIQGDFTNNGNVAPASGQTGTLTFLNNVNGAGSFAGNIVFHGDHSPGNSPASVSFNGGNATYDATSLLTMEILGSTPGTQYDQLVGINKLTFNGRLSLVFGNGFTPAPGSNFSLLKFASFAGSLASDRVDVTGIDRNQLDLTHLGVDGSFAVAAVPEPANYAMFAAGLGLMGLVARRRRTWKEA